MTLPSFLGIGAPRAGTTWLNQLLASHPDVFVPTIRDEIRFFDLYYERGFGWYERLFPPAEQAGMYLAIGEVTPQYLECDECPERIWSALPDCRLIAILRHPVARAYSQYGFFVQRRNFRRSFEEFVEEYPRSLERGFYGRYIDRYLRRFDRERLLVLVFEDAFGDVGATRRTVADFLDLDPERFPASAGEAKVNPSSVPTFQSLYGMVAMTGRQLRRWHLEPVVDLVMRTPLQRYLGRGEPLPTLDEGLKARLSQRYLEEFDELEGRLQIDLSSWRS